MIDFTTIGNYRVISYSTPFLNVLNLRGYIAETANEVPGYAYLQYEFRWSINGDNWSLWIPFIEENLNNVALNPDNPFYLEIRVTAISNPEEISPYLPIGSPISPAIVLEDIQPDLLYRVEDQRNYATLPKIICSSEKYDKPIIFNPNCTSTFDPYAVNMGINIAQDLSRTVNILFGHEVVYYSVQPNGRGRDVVLREYNLFDVVDEKCIKVLVNDNNFGDGRPVFDSFGVQFEAPIEVHIDRKYFESFFGKGAQPRRRDIIYFPLTNRIYSIETTYLHRDFNYAPLYFMCQLVKYEKRQDVVWKDPAKEKELHDYTVNSKDLFEAETKEQIEKVTKPQQYYVSSQRRWEDPVRSYISHKLPILEYNLNNNWTVVFNSYYDLETLSYDGEREAVRYNSSPVLAEDDELSFSCWFKVRNFIDQTKLSPKPPRKLPITSVTQNGSPSFTATYSTYPIKNLLQEGGYVCISGGDRTGGYKVLSVGNNGYEFTIRDNGLPIGDFSQWKMQKGESRNFISGHNGTTGLSIEMIWTGTNPTDPATNSYLETGSFRVMINDKEILSPFGAGISNQSSNFLPSLDNWYGFVFNLSNVFSQFSINAWGLTYDPDNPAAQTSNLTLLHTEEGFLDNKYTFSFPEDKESNHDDPTWGTDKNSYKLLTSPVYVSNLRMFKHMIALEKQSAMLNQNIVNDSQLSIIIDNCKPVLKLPKFVSNR